MTSNIYESVKPLNSSYRDSAGFVFKYENKFYRCINKNYFPHFTMLIQSGLYKELADTGRLIKHEEVNKAQLSNLYFGEVDEVKIILPQQIPFISYPYEWSFDMWKDAAIVTLKVLQISLSKGMILKDATPFNIQFYNGRPVFIDTLSFEKYEAGKPWIAYRQFCESFLSVLLLMHYCHRDMGKLFMAYPEGIPLEITKSILPFKSKLNLHVYLHIWINSKVTANSKEGTKPNDKLSIKKLQILLKGLVDFVGSLAQKVDKSIWDNYYTHTIIGKQYLLNKKIIVEDFANRISFETVIDLGANDGYFSFLLKEKAKNIIAVDFDSNCVNEFYKKIRKDKVVNVIPLVATLNTPSPEIGWANAERTSLTERLKFDLVLALALVHHLAISNNVPLMKIADWLSTMGEYLIIEFIPKTDEKVQQLLMHREDIFADYNIHYFTKVFENYFEILAENKVIDTGRILFLMKRKIK